MDKLAQIETFIDVVDHGSFAGAARAQNVSPVMIGRRIMLLEQRLGGRLFHRTTRTLTLTPEAQVFLENCRSIVAHLVNAERLVADAATHATGHLRVTTTAAFGKKHVFPHLKGFMARNPDVRVSLHLSDQAVDILREGFDVGIRIGVKPDPALSSTTLTSSCSFVCGTREYLARRGVPKHPKDLEQHNCLTFKGHGGQSNGWLFQRRGQALRIPVTGNQSCNDTVVLKKWATAGLGLAYLPDFDVSDLLETGQLITVLDQFCHPPRPLDAVHRQPPPVRATLFIGWLRAIYARPGYWLAKDGAARTPQPDGSA